MKLHEIRDNEGANRKKKRVARGPGSGKGKTAGRGIKGQSSRSGVALNGYEGGQMPLYRRLPKRGFTAPNAKSFAVINLGQLQSFIDAGKIDASAEVTEDALVASGLVRRKLDGVRLLGKGELTSAVTIRVFQGEREMAADNKLLGQFDLVGIPSAPRGVPQIEVTFDIDANGIVSVGAKDKATGKEQSVRIQASGGLSDADVEKMVKDAEAHAAEDKKRRELVEVRNQADGLIHTTERTIKEAGDKIPAADKAAAEKAITELREAMGNDNAETIKSKTEALAQVSMKLGEAVYKAGQDDGSAGPGAGGAGGSAGGDSTVVDADFEEVDDDKKHKSA